MRPVTRGSSLVFFFFSSRRRHTRFDCDWSSDVCSSDLAIQDTLPLIGPGQDPSIVKLGGQTRIVASTTGSATIGVYKPDGSLDHAVQQGAYGPGSDATDRSGTVNLFESASIGKLDPASGPAIV